MEPWAAVVEAEGVEGGGVLAMVRMSPPASVEEPARGGDARAPSLPNEVASACYSLAAALADAVLDGNTATARRLAAQVRELTAAKTAG